MIDYQNIHLTARDTFAPPGTPPEECLIHPLKFAEKVVEIRNVTLGDRQQKPSVLAGVKVFRGQPSNGRQSFIYGISQRQRSEWTRDRRVDVTYRTLKYPPGWPQKPAQEKGIDVLVALAVVRVAASRDYDVVVLASHDTDLEPALEMAYHDGISKIETCGWKDCRVLRVPGKPLWHTSLDGSQMVATRDRQNYLPPERRS